MSGKKKSTPSPVVSRAPNTPQMTIELPIRSKRARPNKKQRKAMRAAHNSPTSSSSLKFMGSSTEDADSSGASSTPPTLSRAQIEHDHHLQCHMKLLDGGEVANEQNTQHELKTAPMFSLQACSETDYTFANTIDKLYPQYGLLAGVVYDDFEPNGGDATTITDPQVFFNVAAPSSTFICGSQGSGKSHTLSCLLENCLIPSKAGNLPNPLTGLIFHYDAFISDDGGSPCEAAFLSSHKNLKVRVLCSPTNYMTIQKSYHSFQNVAIEPLMIDQSNLNTKRMLDLMAVDSSNGPMPLYLHTVYRILRDMRLEQQTNGSPFSYSKFKQLVQQTDMTSAQLAPLQQRLDMLESFMPVNQRSLVKGKKQSPGNDWIPKSGQLTIVDLSCPCVTPEGACALFNICLSIFLEQKITMGRVIALDEAHKFMNASVEAETLTNTLLSTIRLQRHLGARIIISTQQPTISPALLDLCSLTIVHRFTSPEWMKALRAHLAAAATDLIDEIINGDEERSKEQNQANFQWQIFSDIVRLQTGQALLFCPSAVLGLRKDRDGTVGMGKLGTGYVKIRVRKRITEDGGMSVMAS